jgi:hypothetical protein
MLPLLLLLQDPSKRSPLQDEDAGRLLAGIRNALPVEYSGMLFYYFCCYFCYFCYFYILLSKRIGARLVGLQAAV